MQNTKKAIICLSVVHGVVALVYSNPAFMVLAVIAATASIVAVWNETSVGNAVKDSPPSEPSTPYRTADHVNVPNATPREPLPRKAPFLWRTRVWWASFDVYIESDRVWNLWFKSVNGRTETVYMEWADVATYADAWGRVSAGDIAAIVHKDGSVILARAECVPTMARMARAAADAYARKV